MGLFEDMFINDPNKSDREYTEEELDAYGLDEDEKEEVRNGNYDPWNFDDDEIEDDDYYSEEDD